MTTITYIGEGTLKIRYRDLRLEPGESADIRADVAERLADRPDVTVHDTE